ncbi:hypothetical protein AVEN_65424-1 [Araneus ventricosus]|uniref:STPR domain-containing protein n=1 Tax=Araneus ventricosus TaxID=182803 RepID=A0A4Y2W399_ARAVE|nr:hypothetical protein AVEN_65424-1 [Araneus ventricosus]
MPKRKRGITGDAASRREAIRKRERRVVKTEEERSRRLSTMAQRGQDRRAEEQRNSRLSDMAQRWQERRAEETEEQRNRRLAVMGQRSQQRGAEETEEQRNSRLAVMAQRGQERRAEETNEQRNSRLAVMRQRSQQRRAEEREEQRNSRLAKMAQRGQERRAEETDKQRNSRLSAMLQHVRERRLNVIEGQNHHQIQTFYAARTVLYPIVEEHNCGEMHNLCLKCGGLYFRDEKNTRGIYSHCCHNENIIEQASVYPVEMKGLMAGSDELSVHFKNNIRSYQCFNGCTDCTTTGRGAYCFRIHNQIYHRTSHLHPAEAGGENTNALQQYYNTH